ncbi:hypothetical protein ADIS_4130 [Lunatimonas lonarensis]|uniref:Uncharacterized protein n=1 Tax=Lunatimonas lonarensis TaxID=1232681 RepID=R7ZMU8_9BACT|nr:hypothetical protein ADIS_4130 [Lunatimonas lonarensis]
MGRPNTTIRNQVNLDKILHMKSILTSGRQGFLPYKLGQDLTIEKQL